MSYPLATGASVVLAILVSACAGESAQTGPAASGALDGPDRNLALEPTPVYQIGGFDASGWEAFGTVSSMRFDATGRLYVLDSQTDQVTVVDTDGSYLRTVGEKGEGPGEISSAFGFEVLPEGQVAIFDFGSRGFLIYDGDGTYLRTATVDFEGMVIPNRAMQRHPAGGVISAVGGAVRIGAGGRIEAGEETRPIAYFALAEGEESRVVYEAWDLPEEEDLEAETLQVGGGNFVSIGMGRERAFEPGLYAGALPDGRIAVVDSIGYRVKLLDLSGQVVRTLERPVPPTPVTAEIEEAEKARRLAALEEGGGGAGAATMVFSVQRSRSGGGGGGSVGVDQGAVRDMQTRRIESMTFAEEIPVIEGMAVDWAGRIWVERSSGVPGEDGPTDVITADGQYLGTLPADGLRIPMAFGPNGLIARIETDEFDVPTLIVERLPGEWSEGN